MGRFLYDFSFDFGFNGVTVAATFGRIDNTLTGSYDINFNDINGYYHKYPTLGILQPILLFIIIDISQRFIWCFKPVANCFLLLFVCGLR